MINKQVGLIFILLAIATVAYAQADTLQNSGPRSELCTGCHDSNGNNADPFLPWLAGQNMAYLTGQIKAFREGSRDHPVIPSLATTLSDNDIADFAAFYAGLAQKSTEPNVENSGPELIEEGRSKYTPCTACHGVNGEGISPFPRLAGQQPEYLRQQLMKFKTGARPNTTMRDMSVNLSEDDIEALALYLATLK